MMRMMQWYAHRRWIYLGLVILLALDAGVYFGWVSNPAVVAEADPAQVRQLELEVALLRIEVGRLERVQRQVPRMGRRNDGFVAEKFLSGEEAYAHVDAELFEAARAAGVQLSRVTFEESVEQQRPDLLRVEMVSNVEGTYANLLRYLHALERSPQFYLVTEMNLVGAAGGQIGLRIRMATYFRRGQM